VVPISRRAQDAVSAQTPGPRSAGRGVPHDGQSEAAQASAVKTGNVRLFTLGLGRDVNKPLLSRLGGERGRFVFIENAQEIESKVDRLAANISKPLLVDVNVTVDGANATRMYPRTLAGSVRRGRAASLGPAPRYRLGEFKITGKLAGKQVEYVKTVDIARRKPSRGPRHCGPSRGIDHLLEEIALDASKAEYKTRCSSSRSRTTSSRRTPRSRRAGVELGAMHDTVTAARERKAKDPREQSRRRRPRRRQARHGRSQHAPFALIGGRHVVQKSDADDDRDGAEDAEAHGPPRQREGRVQGR